MGKILTKYWKKREIEWLRDDIMWNTEMIGKFDELRQKHLKEADNDHCQASCALCKDYFEIIKSFQEEVRKSKQRIKEIIIGE